MTTIQNAKDPSDVSQPFGFPGPGQNTGALPDERGRLHHRNVVSLDPRALLALEEIAESVFHHLERVTPCFAAGILIVGLGEATDTEADAEHETTPRQQLNMQAETQDSGLRRGQALLFCARPVDPLFLQAVQRRLLLSYQLYVGPALAEPEIEVTTYGNSVPGPYEPPRSLLTTPLLFDGYVSGILAIASIFPGAFCSKDMCVLSNLAAQVSAALARVRLDALGAPAISGAPTAAVFTQYLTSILGLAELWQARKDIELPDVLRKDLDTIIQNASHVMRLIREYLKDDLHPPS